MNTQKYLDNLNKIQEENSYKLIADKIITILKGIKNDQNISSRRWIWELMQNATDVKYEKEKISIKIILDKDKLEFKHNGKYFRIEDIFSLLMQVSSKSSQNADGQTGKFGTGFIGTHLLSDIIDIKGIVLVNNNDFREFTLSLDRSERISEKLAKNIKKSIEMFKKIENQKNFKLKPNYLQNRKETDFDTSFTYHLTDKEKKESAINGIDDLINTLPISLITQNKKIKQVTIIDNIKQIKTSYIPIMEEKEKENNITQSSVKVTNKNKNNVCFNSEYHFLSYLKVDNKKEKLRLILGIINKEKEIIILRKNENKPILYRNFPLIGSNEFNMPFFVDGFNFYPLESRSGILLNGGRNENNLETQENMELINKAFDTSIEFIKCILEKYKYIRHRFLLASSKLPKPIVTFDSYAESWIKERQKIFREKLKDLPLLEFGNKNYNLSELLLPIFKEKCNLNFYDVVFNLNVRKKILPQKEYYKECYSIIVEENHEVQGLNIKDNPLIKTWGMTKNEENGEFELNYIYDEIDLLKDLTNCKNISTLSKKLNKEIEDTINNLNHFLQFLQENCKYDEILNKYPIIPNRKGDFIKIENLYSDDENIIPNEVMDIYDSISTTKLKDELIDSRINIKYLGDLLKKKKLDSISDYLNNYILKNKDIEKTKKLVVYPLLSIKSSIKQVSKINYFLTFFYDLKEKNILTNNNKTIIPIYFWEFAVKFWFNEHPKEIEKYQNINGLSDNLIKKMDNIEILNWMNDYLDFLKNNSQDKNFENLKIFPNQNGDFCSLHSLYSDSGFPEEFKDILKNYFNIDKRNILLAQHIKAYKDNKTMHEKEITKEIKNEFNNLLEKNKNNDKLEDIAFDILCLYPENKENKEYRKIIETIISPKRSEKELNSDKISYLGFAEVAYNKKDKFIIKYINTETLEYKIFIDYIIERICDKIEKAGDFENIKKNFYGIDNLNDLENFLIKLIKFIWDNQNNDYPIKSCIDTKTSEKKVFLNGKNQLKKISEVQLKIDFEYKDKEKIIYDICLNNKHIKKDFQRYLLNENLNKSLYSYKDKFYKIDIRSICRYIDDVIMKYVQKEENQGKIYDNEFFELSKTVNNLKLKKELMEDYFPYFWANKSSIIMSCIEKDKIEPLVDKICEGKIEEILNPDLLKKDEQIQKIIDQNKNIIKQKDEEIQQLNKEKEDALKKKDEEIKKKDEQIKQLIEQKEEIKKVIQQLNKEKEDALEKKDEEIKTIWYEWENSIRKSKDNNNKKNYKDHLTFNLKNKFNHEIIFLDEKKKENLMKKGNIPIKNIEIKTNKDFSYNNEFDFKIIIPENYFKEKNNKDIKIECKKHSENNGFGFFNFFFNNK